MGGISSDTPNKVFGIFNALGTVAFAYNFATVLLEIQASRSEAKTYVVRQAGDARVPSSAC